VDNINKLDNFDGPIEGGIDVVAELYEEALAMVKKFDFNVQAVNVLLDNTTLLIELLSLQSEWKRMKCGVKLVGHN
jgi:hypothetical protein